MVHRIEHEDHVGKISAVVLGAAQANADTLAAQLKSCPLIGEIHMVFTDDSQEALAGINTVIEKTNDAYLYILFHDDIPDMEQLSEVLSFQEKNDGRVFVTAFTQSESIQGYSADKDDNVTGIYLADIESEYEIKAFNFLLKITPDLRLREDIPLKCACTELFLRLISEKGEFGFVKEGCSQHKPHLLEKISLASMEDYRKFYSVLDFMLSRENSSRNGISPLTEKAILNLFAEALKETGLVPERFDILCQKELHQRIHTILSRVRDSVIRNPQSFDTYQFCYLLGLKGKNIHIIRDDGSFGISDGTKILAAWKKAECWILSMRLTESSLTVRCVFQTPVSCIVPFTPYLLCNGERMALESSESGLSWRGLTQKIADIRECTIQLPNGRNAVYSFEIELQGHFYPARISYHEQLPINMLRGKARLIGNQTKYLFTSKNITAFHYGTVDRLRELKWDMDDLKRIAPETGKLRNKIRFQKLRCKKNVWLYIDSAGDSGFREFYRKESQKKDKEERYFCTLSEQILKSGLPNCILLRGGELEGLLSRVKRLITDTPRFDEYCPVSGEKWKYYNDLLDYEVFYWHAKGIGAVRDMETICGLMNMDGEITV